MAAEPHRVRRRWRSFRSLREWGLIAVCAIVILSHDPIHGAQRNLGKKNNPAISSQRRKARKRLFTATMPVKRNMMRGHFTHPLREKFQTRNVILRAGDLVKIERGDFKGKSGTITKTFPMKLKVAISGITHRTSTGKIRPFLIYANKLTVLALGPRREQFSKFYTEEDEKNFEEFEINKQKMMGRPDMEDIERGREELLKEFPEAEAESPSYNQHDDVQKSHGPESTGGTGGDNTVLEPPVEEELVGDDGEDIGRYEEEGEGDAGVETKMEEEDNAEDMEVDDDGDEYTDEEYGRATSLS